jgi:hypothetical protein
MLKHRQKWFLAPTPPRTKVGETKTMQGGSSHRGLPAAANRKKFGQGKQELQQCVGTPCVISIGKKISSSPHAPHTRPGGKLLQTCKVWAEGLPNAKDRNWVGLLVPEIWKWQTHTRTHGRTHVMANTIVSFATQNSLKRPETSGLRPIPPWAKTVLGLDFCIFVFNKFDFKNTRCILLFMSTQLMA